METTTKEDSLEMES